MYILFVHIFQHNFPISFYFNAILYNVWKQKQALDYLFSCIKLILSTHNNDCRITTNFSLSFSLVLFPSLAWILELDNINKTNVIQLSLRYFVMVSIILTHSCSTTCMFRVWKLFFQLIWIWICLCNFLFGFQVFEREKQTVWMHEIL